MKPSILGLAAGAVLFGTLVTSPRASEPVRSEQRQVRSNLSPHQVALFADVESVRVEVHESYRGTTARIEPVIRRIVETMAKAAGWEVVRTDAPQAGAVIRVELRDVVAEGEGERGAEEPGELRIAGAYSLTSERGTLAGRLETQAGDWLREEGEPKPESALLRAFLWSGFVESLGPMQAAIRKVPTTTIVSPLLLDSSAAVRAVAALVLGASDEKEGVEPLAAALEDEKEIVRQSAAVGLGKLKDPRGVEPLVALLKKGRHGVDEAYAIEALGKIGDARAVGPILEACAALVTGGGDVRVGTAIAFAMRTLGAKAVEPLSQALTDPRPAVRQAAVFLLDQACGSREGLDGGACERIYRYLVSALAAEEAEVREAAVVRIGWLGEKRALAGLKKIAETDENRSVREAAEQAIKALQEEDAEGATRQEGAG